MNKKDIQLLDSIKSNAIKLLWYANKHDGIPYCGLMLYNGRKCWYRVYDIDCEEKMYSDADFLKQGYRQEQLDLMDDDDRIWYDEKFYYKVYELKPKELRIIEENHEKFRNKYGKHTDYEYEPKTKKRGEGIDSLLDNVFVRLYKKIKSKFPKKKRVNISNKSINDDCGLYEKDIIGYFRI